MADKKKPESEVSSENVNPTEWMDMDDDVEAIGGIDAYLSEGVEEKDPPSDRAPY
ncbi:hypothetical protein U6G28_05500 [Actinomycetaceae bacterium MB13-C1-2]|nr:hypothetical protein U6G28_05500 [Actinomycetaceae bacterium MB13-C1-2]